MLKLHICLSPDQTCYCLFRGEAQICIDADLVSITSFLFTLLMLICQDTGQVCRRVGKGLQGERPRTLAVHMPSLH